MTQSGSSVKTVFSLWVHFKEMSQEYHHYTYWKKNLIKIEHFVHKIMQLC